MDTLWGSITFLSNHSSALPLYQCQFNPTGSLFMDPSNRRQTPTTKKLKSSNVFNYRIIVMPVLVWGKCKQARLDNMKLCSNFRKTCCKGLKLTDFTNRVNMRSPVFQLWGTTVGIGTAGGAETCSITSAGSTTACLCAALVWSAEVVSTYSHPCFELFVLCSCSWEMPVTMLINVKCPQSSIQIAINMSRVHKMNWTYWIACSLRKHISQQEKQHYWKRHLVHVRFVLCLLY